MGRRRCCHVQHVSCRDQEQTTERKSDGQLLKVAPLKIAPPSLYCLWALSNQGSNDTYQMFSLPFAQTCISARSRWACS